MTVSEPDTLLVWHHFGRMDTNGNIGQSVDRLLRSRRKKLHNCTVITFCTEMFSFACFNPICFMGSPASLSPNCNGIHISYTPKQHAYLLAYLMSPFFSTSPHRQPEQCIRCYQSPWFGTDRG